MKEILKRYKSECIKVEIENKDWKPCSHTKKRLKKQQIKFERKHGEEMKEENERNTMSESLTTRRNL